MKKQTRAELALFSITAIWGATFVVSKLGLEDISPVLLIALRFSLATVALLVLFRRSLFPISSGLWLRGGILGFFLFAGFITQTIGLQYTTASKSAFITGMMVIGVPLLQILVERRPPKYGNLIGVLIVSIGLWMLTSPQGSAFTMGDGLTLVCAAMFAGYIVYLDMLPKEIEPSQLTFVQLAVTSLLSCLFLPLEDLRFVMSWSGVLTVLYLMVFATVIATYVQTRYQKDTTPTRAVIIFMLEPVVASVLASIVLDEVMGGVSMIGGALIITGVLLSEFSDDVAMLNKSFSFSREKESTGRAKPV